MEFLIMAFNLVVLTGRITAEVELKTTPNGVSVCTFSIAVDRGYGENKQTDFINCVAWRSTAEFVSKYFSKGSMIGIEGSIQTRKYQDKNGNTRTAFEVVANNVQFMESKKTEADPLKAVAEKVNVVVDADKIDGDLPF
jgi:single-strand DNA-binding protein